MKDNYSPWVTVLIAVLMTTVMACSAVITLPQIATAFTPPAPQPPAGQLPTLPIATLGPTTVATRCPNGDCANACVAKLNSIPQSSGSSEYRPKAAGQGPNGPPAVVLVTYPVNGNTLGTPKFGDQVPSDLVPLQQDQAAQQKIWDYFTAIIPEAQRTSIAYYIVATDGSGGMLASVEQFSGDSGAWALVVDPADAGKPRDLTFTLLHEFGHLLTLNSSQVKPDQAVLQHPNDLRVYEREAASCPQYFASGGCSLPDSYINQFFEQFWTDIYGQWSTVNAARQDSDYLALLAHFYRTHASQFVTPYAATSPEEDMAETWASFILNPKPPADTIAHKKILFFYGFPELVNLRNEIISNICVYAANQ